MRAIRLRIRAIIATAALTLTSVAASPVMGQDPPNVPPDLDQAIRAVGDIEMRFMGGVPDTAAVRELADALSAARERLSAALDRHVLQAPGGAEVLNVLRDRYPGALILDRYAADLALQTGRPEEAEILYRRLISLQPGSPDLHVSLARASEQLGRDRDAWTGYRRALDLQPASDTIFRALVRLASDSADLGDLLRQVRRLRGIGGGEVLLDREVELLHRLGRAEEARRVRACVPDSLPAGGVT